MAAAALARPQEPLSRGVIPILDFHLETDEFNQHALSYLTADGTRVTQQGYLVPSPTGDGTLIYVMKGSFSYYAPDGTLIEETWTADAEGFHPKGKHLPTPPPALAESVEPLS